MLAYSSRPLWNRGLLALALAATVFSAAAHVASFWGIAFIPNRAWQQRVTLTLGAAMFIGILMRSRRSAGQPLPRLPKLVEAVWIVIAINACSYLLPGLPLSSDRVQFYARVSSAAHLWASLTLLLFLWFDGAYPDEPTGALPPAHMPSPSLAADPDIPRSP
jgi:hypothetical protein